MSTDIELIDEVPHNCEGWPGRMRGCPECKRQRSATSNGDLATRLEGLLRDFSIGHDKYATQIVNAAAERLRESIRKLPAVERPGLTLEGDECTCPHLRDKPFNIKQRHLSRCPYGASLP